VAQARYPLDLFLAGLTRAELPGGEAVEAVGLMGAFPPRGAAGVPTALVFLEWTDCRGWRWQALVDAINYKLMKDKQAEASA
jgi:hypothetical protein